MNINCCLISEWFSQLLSDIDFKWSYIIVIAMNR